MSGGHILITGATGFLGAGLVRRLLQEGKSVHVLVRPGTNTWRLDGLENRLTVHWADLRDAAAVRRSVAACRPELVYHLAAAGVVCQSQYTRTELLACNVLGTANLLDGLANQDYRRLVHVGSGVEYGPHNGPIHETERLQPQTNYAVSKAAASLLVQAEVQRGRPIVIVRVFAVYGPGEDGTRLVPYLMRCCLRSEVPRVSEGSQRRDFIFLFDVVELLCLAADCPAVVGQALHAGTGQELSVRTMVHEVLRVCGGQHLPVVFGGSALHPGETPHYRAGIEMTRRLTGWLPQHSIEAGIRETWDWHLTRDDNRKAA
jgi:nucleoside-diphosphate-sugar epimerase